MNNKYDKLILQYLYDKGKYHKMLTFDLITGVRETYNISEYDISCRHGYLVQKGYIISLNHTESVILAPGIDFLASQKLKNKINKFLCYPLVVAVLGGLILTILKIYT
ncbi:MAG: hypothetical protein K2Y14_12895 [Burkholderiales bacterium]|nr:hypothetical protein [Burkholderiales bacterium]